MSCALFTEIAGSLTGHEQEDGHERECDQQERPTSKSVDGEEAGQSEA